MKIASLVRLFVLATVLPSAAALAGATQGQTPTAPSPGHASKAPKSVSLKFDIIANGTSVGTATFDRNTLATSRKVVLVLSISFGGQDLKINVKEETKPDGTPVRKEFSQEGGGQNTNLSAVFNGSTAAVTTLADGKPTVTKVTAPKNAILADASSAWFDTITPKVGDVVKFTNFNLQNAAWEVTTTTYIGDEDINIGGKTIKAHHVQEKSDSGEVNVFLDDNGDPYIIDQTGQIKLTRKV